MNLQHGIRANLDQFLHQLLQVLLVGLTIGMMRTVVPALARRHRYRLSCDRAWRTRGVARIWSHRHRTGPFSHTVVGQGHLALGKS